MFDIRLVNRHVFSVAAAVAFTLIPASAVCQTLHTSDKAIPDVVLSGLADEERLSFMKQRQVGNGTDTAGAATLIRTDAIVSWGAWQPTTSNAAVWLADGSWLAGTVTLTDATVRITPAWAEIASLKFPQVAGVILDPPKNPNRLCGLIQQMMTSSGARDLVWLKSGQKVSGLLRLKGHPDNGVAFTLGNGGKVVGLAREEIRAFVFSPDLVSAPSVSQLDRTVGLQDGSLIHVRDLHASLSALLAPKSKLRFSTHGGLEIVPRDRAQEGGPTPSNSVTYINAIPSGVGLLGLSEPLTYKFGESSLLQWPLGRNTDIHQNLLRDGPRIVPRGLAMHAPSQVAFRVAEGSQRFIAEVTLSGALPHRSDSRRIDASDPSVGSVICEVVVARDGKLETLASVQLSISQRRSAILDVACSGSSLVVLVVRESDLGNYGDQVCWTGARLIQLADPFEQNKPADPLGR